MKRQEDIRTLTELFLDHTSGHVGSLPYVSHKPDRNKPYETLTYSEFSTRVRAFASGLAALGVKRGDRIALLAESRPEWLITDFAALALGAITVPMFPTLTAKQVEYVLQHSGAMVAVVSNDVQLSKVIKSIPELIDLRHILVMNENFNAGPVQSSIQSFKRVQELTKPPSFDFDTEANLAKPEDIITIIYTSGTTGQPKGVQLTHNNLLADIRGALANLPPIGETDTFLSFLPLSHGFERLASYLLFYCGAHVAFAESADTIADNMLEVKPTIMTGVPRFFERIHGRIMRSREKLSGAKLKIFDWSLKIGKECGKSVEGEQPSVFALLKRPIADALVLKKIRARTGGRIRFFVSGGAALSAEVGRAFSAFGLVIIEGYGMTESSPVISVTPIEKVKWGAVGKPIAGIEVKIAEDGEILTRGPHVMKGYYKDVQATNEAIDAEGWLHTGDIGIIDSEGYVKITDRKKHIFISEGGKNIAPGPIESLLTQSKYIDQVMLVGDKRLFCTALIVPDYDAIKETLKIDISHEEIASREDARDLISKELEGFQKELASYERVRRFALLPEAFTVENELMTPTLKVKRKVVEARYKELIDSLYASLGK